MGYHGAVVTAAASKKELRILCRDSAFAELALPVLGRGAYDRLRRLGHHDGSIADHSAAVAYASYRLARFLGLRATLPQLVRGALLHDYFLYDWRKEKPRSGGLHGFDHPREALENAEAAFGPLSERERDCILRHMWPLTPVPPRYPESLVVCLADKAVALREALRSLRERRGLGVL